MRKGKIYNEFSVCQAKVKDMECQEEKNLDNCNCTYPGCPRKGKCCECIQYHLQRNELPACAFPDEVEDTYDRSFEKFIQVYS